MPFAADTVTITIAQYKPHLADVDFMLLYLLETLIVLVLTPAGSKYSSRDKATTIVWHEAPCVSCSSSVAASVNVNQRVKCRLNEKQSRKIKEVMHTRVEAVDGREGGDLLGVVQLKRLDQFVLVVWHVPTSHNMPMQRYCTSDNCNTVREISPIWICDLWMNCLTKKIVSESI